MTFDFFLTYLLSKPKKQTLGYISKSSFIPKKCITDIICKKLGDAERPKRAGNGSQNKENDRSVCVPTHHRAWDTLVTNDEAKSEYVVIQLRTNFIPALAERFRKES
jgi:hypothetical protein